MAALILGCVTSSNEPATGSPSRATASTYDANRVAPDSTTTHARSIEQTSFPDRAATTTQSVAGSRRARGAVTHEGSGLLILDPLVGWPVNGFPLEEIFGGLTQLDGTLAGDVEPGLAASWTVDKEGRRFVFTLREGLRFSDGTPVTAEDAKWSWERALRPENLTQPAIEAFGAITGAAELMTGQARSLSGVVALDDRNLSVELSRRQAQFLGLLASPVASVLRRENVTVWGTMNWTQAASKLQLGVRQDLLVFDELPVGTGPFRVAYVIGLEEVGLEPNPHFHGGPPDLRRLTATTAPVVLDETYGRLRLSTRADVKRRAPRNIDDFRSGDDSSQNWTITVRAPEVNWLAFNTALAPFDDADFRRALAVSLRRPGAPESESLGIPADWATGLIPPGFAHGGRDLIDTLPDEDAARTLFDAWRQSSGDPSIRLEFHVDESLPGLKYFEGLSRNWRIWLKLDILDTSSDPFQSIQMFFESLAEDTLQLRYVHVKPRYPDPCAILCRIPDLFGPNAQSAETEQLREMLHDAAATADRAARLAKYQAIEEHVLERALVVPIAWDDGTELLEVKPWISGYRLPAYGGSQYAGVVVDTTHPEYPRERLTDDGWSR